MAITIENVGALRGEAQTRLELGGNAIIDGLRRGGREVAYLIIGDKFYYTTAPKSPVPVPLSLKLMQGAGFPGKRRLFFHNLSNEDLAREEAVLALKKGYKADKWAMGGRADGLSSTAQGGLESEEVKSLRELKLILVEPNSSDYLQELRRLYPTTDYQPRWPVSLLTHDASSVTLEGVRRYDGYATVHRIYMAAAYAVVGGRPTGANPDNAVGAIVTDAATGKIVSWGRKASASTAFHAEVVALTKLLPDGFPKQTRIYTTLKPCKMCSAFITAQGLDCNYAVYYSTDDTGKLATGTMLDNDGLCHHLQDIAGLHPVGAGGFDKSKTIGGELLNTSGGNSIVKHTGGAGMALVNQAGEYLLWKAGKYRLKFDGTDDPTEPAIGAHNPNVRSALRHVLSFIKANGANFGQ